MAVSFDQTTQGYSSSGARAYINDFNAKAIDETKALLSKIDGVYEAFRSGWMGKSEEIFEKNLQNAITKVQTSLEECKTAFETQMADIESAYEDFDTNLVKPE